MTLEPGDLIVDHTAPPESQDGLMLVINERLIVESLDCFTLPCQVTHLHRNGLQGQHPENRIAGRKSRSFGLWRLTEPLSPREAARLEQIARNTIRDTSFDGGASSVVAISRMLIQVGKLPEIDPTTYTVSMLVSALVVNDTYQHTGEPHVEALSLPPAAA